MDRASGADDDVPVRLVSVHPPGTGPASWVPDGPRPDGQDVETKYLATEVQNRSRPPRTSGRAMVTLTGFR